MPELAVFLQSPQSRLVVLVADSEAEAQQYVLDQFAKVGHPDLPLWGWSAKRGLFPVAGNATTGLQTGIGKGGTAKALATALQAFQDWNKDGALLIFGAGKLGVNDQLCGRLRQQHEGTGLAPWAMLVSVDRVRQGGEFADALKMIDAEPNTFTVVVGSSAGPTPVKLSADGLEDIETLARFDTPEWTERLNRLSLAELQKICESNLYRSSVERARGLCSAMKKVFVQKDELIDLMGWCSIAHLPMIMLGPWGTGKSMLVRQWSLGLGIAPEQRYIAQEDQMLADLAQQNGAGTGRHLLFGGQSARHFEYLVTRFTTPEELLGAVNIDVLLKHAIHFRQTQSLMPRAEIVFLDEVFKANSAILNALLSIINERLFYNAGLPWVVNLVMLFAASNEPPQEEELGAFYDRFPVRALCRSVDHDHLEGLLDHSHAQQFLSLVPRDAPDKDLVRLDPQRRLRERRMRQMACVNDFRLLRKVCLYQFGGADLSDRSPGSQDFLRTFLSVFRNLRDEHDISDRSCAHFYRLARARALLEGREQLIRDDCRVLGYCGKDEKTARDLPGMLAGLI